MGQTQLTTADIPRLLDDLRGRIQSKLRRPIDPDLDFLTTQIEVASMVQAIPQLSDDDLVPDHSEWADYQLTDRESQLASALKARFGKPVKKLALYDIVYPYESHQPNEKILDVWICKLRRKLRNSPYGIETIWGRGYRMVDSSTAHAVRTILRSEWREGIRLAPMQAKVVEALYQANGQWIPGPQLPSRGASSLMPLIRKRLAGTCFLLEGERKLGYRLVRNVPIAA